MSNSKSKKRSSSKIEESIDMDTDIASEHQQNDPIEIEDAMMYKVLMITNSSVVVPNRLSLLFSIP